MQLGLRGCSTKHSGKCDKFIVHVTVTKAYATVPKADVTVHEARQAPEGPKVPRSLAQPEISTLLFCGPSF